MKQRKHDATTYFYGCIALVPLVGAYLWLTAWVWAGLLRTVVV